MTDLLSASAALLSLCTDLMRALTATRDCSDYLERLEIVAEAEERYGKVMERVLGDDPKGEGK